MPAAVRNITIEQGATFSETYTYPAVLTDYTGASQIRDNFGRGTLVAEFAVVVTPGTTTTSITRTLTAIQTAAIPYSARNLAQDMEISSPDGVVSRLVQGKVAISLEVTRDV